MTHPMHEIFTWVDLNLEAMHGWTTPEKAKRIIQAIYECDAQTSCEVGTFAGRGTLSMAMAHKGKGSGRVWGIDPWLAEACTEGHNDPANDEWWRTKIDYPEIYKTFVNHVIAHELLPFCSWHRWKSSEVVSFFKDNSIDVLIIDGNHSEEVSCKDVEEWTPKVSPRGYLFLDDTDWPTTKAAQDLILTKGFAEIENYVKWKVYQKA